MSSIGTENGVSRFIRRITDGLWITLRLVPKSLAFPILGIALVLLTISGVPLARAVDVGGRPTFAWLLADVGRLPATYGYVILGSAIAVSVFGYLVGRWCDQATHLSVTDPLTGLFNRRHFSDRLNREVRRARRESRPTCVLFLDVDHLKEINSRFGHKTGDEALMEMGRIISRNVRPADVAARCGGDEFEVLLPGTTSTGASAISDRILRAVAAQDRTLSRFFEVSIGIAQLHAETSSEELVAAADAALYRAKAAGGARAAVAGADDDAAGAPPPREADLFVKTRALLGAIH